MSSEDGAESGRRTRGKGQRKAGRGPDADVEDEPESDAAADAQRTIDEIENDLSSDDGWGTDGESVDEGAVTANVVDASTWSVLRRIEGVPETAKKPGEAQNEVVDRIIHEVLERTDEDVRDESPL